jgi:hypothetical protein
MLKTFSVVLITLAMSVGFADARHRNTIPGCAVGEPATAKCVCGMRAFRPLLCRPGQWCHPSGWCTRWRYVSGTVPDGSLFTHSRQRRESVVTQGFFGQFV